MERAGGELGWPTQGGNGGPGRAERDNDQGYSPHPADRWSERHARSQRRVQRRNRERADGEEGERRGELFAVVRCPTERREVRREAFRLEGAPQRQHGPRSDCECVRREPKSFRIRRDQHGYSEKECEPWAPPEREVERRQQDDERRRRKTTDDCVTRLGRESQCEDAAERAEGPERVPVPERLGEPVGGDGVIGRQSAREQPRREAVHGERSHRDEYRAQHGSYVISTYEESERRGKRDVAQGSLDLVHRLRGRRGPEKRQGGPAEERNQRTHIRDLVARNDNSASDQECHERAPREQEGAPSPRGRGIAAVRGRRIRRHRELPATPLVRVAP